MSIFICSTYLFIFKITLKDVSYFISGGKVVPKVYIWRWLTEQLRRLVYEKYREGEINAAAALLAMGRWETLSCTAGRQETSIGRNFNRAKWGSIALQQEFKLLTGSSSSPCCQRAGWRQAGWDLGVSDATSSDWLLRWTIASMNAVIYVKAMLRTCLTKVLVIMSFGTWMMVSDDIKDGVRHLELIRVRDNR